VSLNPLFAGAWLDLAIASYRSGDPAAALEHLEYLRSQFALTDALAAQVDHWASLCQNLPGKTEAAAWQGEIALSLGHDSNANTGLARDQLVLTLPTGSRVFDVAEAYLPHADAFSQQSLSLLGPVQHLGPAHFTPVLVVSSKQYQTETDFSTLDIQTGVSLQRATPAHGAWQVNLFAQYHQQGGQAQYHGLRLGAAQTQPWQTCQRSLGAELETRQHQQTPNLGGDLVSLNAGWACPLQGKASMAANLQWGAEHAHLDRAGGNNTSTTVTLRYDRPMNSTQSWQIMLQLNNMRDQAGYSPLMQDNAVRNVQRQLLAVSWRQHISRQWQAHLSLETVSQRSNLALFEQQGSNLAAGLAYLFE
jgi:hypothetical protein